MLSLKKKLMIFFCTLLPILVAAGFAIKERIDNKYTLQITLEGEREIFLEYGKTYEPLCATAEFWGTHLDTTPIPVDVDVVGEVDDRVVGTYTIEYTAKCKNVVATEYRTVHITDSVLPSITLVSNPETYTLPGQPYAEEGYTASDNYDGDITDRVLREEVDGQVIYTVADTAGNTVTTTREVRYDDPIPPKLTLKGDSLIAMTAGKPYTEPGYSAQDNCEGDITSKVTVSGSVDGYMPGTYTLKYTVTDNYGNAAQATRTVQVSPHPVQEHVENPEKVIYLTFDDGPGPHTPRLLDVLKKYNVKATFFVVNTRYISTIKRASNEGHTIAIHSATHNFHEIYASEDAYFNDLYKMQSVIQNITGQTATIIRFPGGGSNTISDFNPGIMTRLVKLVKEKGFRYFDWNVDSNDAGGARSTSQVFYNVINGIGNKKSAIVLQHDIKGFSVDAVERIINWGLENGYTFQALTSNSPVCEHKIQN